MRLPHITSTFLGKYAVKYTYFKIKCNQVSYRLINVKKVHMNLRTQTLFHRVSLFDQFLREINDCQDYYRQTKAQLCAVAVAPLAFPVCVSNTDTP